MKVNIKAVQIEDFRNLSGEFQFTPGANYIRGANGSGKTNLLHAITWALFGKTMDDRAKFEAQPLNPDGTRTEREPDITLTLDIDGEETVLRRQLKGGKTTQTYINGAPTKTLKEYDATVADLFGNADRFKLFTNPLHFPEALTWQEQRALFMQFFPLPDPAEVISYMTAKDADYTELDLAIGSGKRTPEQEQERLQLRLKEIKAAQDKTAAQIELLDEQLEGQHTDTPEEILAAERDTLREQREEIKRTNDRARHSFSEDRAAVAQEANEATARWDKVRQESEQETRQYEDQRRRLVLEIERMEREIRALSSQMNTLAHAHTDDTCPTCKQSIDAQYLEYARADAHHQQMELADKGKQIAGKRREHMDALAQLEESKPEPFNRANMEREIETIWQTLRAEPDYKTFDNQERLDQLERQIARYDLNRENMERRKKLATEQRKLGREFEETEGLLMDLTEFYQARAEILVKQVNSRFDKISIKVLEIQRNGQPRDTFQITKDGVPYAELNTAGKLQAGLELSGFIKEALGYETPVLIDNGERYTDMSLGDIKGQALITIATKGKPLTVAAK